MQEYNILAPKIFSNDPIQLQFEIINIVKQKKSRGLEVALYDYHDFSPEVIYEIQKIENEGEIDVNKILNLIKKEFKIFDKTEQKELLTKVIQLIIIIKKEV